MANKVTIKLNSEGVRSLLRSGEVLAVCEKYANQAVSRLGSGYEVSTYVGPKRVNASVAAVSADVVDPAPSGGDRIRCTTE